LVSFLFAFIESGEFVFKLVVVFLAKAVMGRRVSKRNLTELICARADEESLSCGRCSPSAKYRLCYRFML